MAKRQFNQCDLILGHILKYGAISDKEAYNMYSCRRLGARIHDLRHRGYDITTTMVKRKNQFGYTVEYAVYRIADAKVD